MVVPAGLRPPLDPSRSPATTASPSATSARSPTSRPGSLGSAVGQQEPLHRGARPARVAAVPARLDGGDRPVDGDHVRRAGLGLPDPGRGPGAAFAALRNGATGVGNYLMQSVTQGLQFGVAVAVILFGVRTILAELVPAFQGIAAKVVPGRDPRPRRADRVPLRAERGADRLPVQLRRRPGRPRGAARSGSTRRFGLALILPGLVPHFFTGGAAGVYGNAVGGRRGAMAGGLVNGLLITFLPAAAAAGARRPSVAPTPPSVTPTSAGSASPSATRPGSAASASC